MVATEGYPAPLGLRFLGSSITQGVALGYPISPVGAVGGIIFLDACSILPTLKTLTPEGEHIRKNLSILPRHSV